MKEKDEIKDETSFSKQHSVNTLLNSKDPSLPTINKKWLLVSLCLLLVVAFMVFIPRDAMLDHFKELEQEQITRNADMLHYALLAEIEAIDNMCLDWSNWDDTYYFMQHHNMDYIESNIDWEALKEKSKLDLLYFINNKGEVIWAGQSWKAAENGDQTVSMADPELVNCFNRIGTAPYRGVLTIREAGALIVSARFIHTTAGTELPPGILIMGRSLDEKLIDKWSHQTQLDMQLGYEGQQAFTAAEQDLVEKLRHTPHLVVNLDENEPRAYFLHNDLLGNPLLASFAWPGDLLSQGNRVADYAYLAFFDAILLIAAGFLVLFYIYYGQVRRNRKEMELELDRRSRELANSEERYRKLVDQAEDAMYIYRLDLSFLDVNKKAVGNLGYTRREVMGIGVKGIVDPEWLCCTAGQVQSVREHGNARYESLHVRKDGSRVPVEVSSQLIDYDGQPAILSVARDISARKQAEEALKASERLYRIIFENSPVGIVYIDNGLRAIYSNQHMEKIFSTEAYQNFLGQELTSSHIGDHMMELLQRARGGEKTSFEGEYRPPWGEPVMSLKVLFHPVTPHKAPSEVICLFEDISVRRRNEELLRQLYTAIEQSPVSVVICDKNGNIQYCNLNYNRVSGYSFEELAGKPPGVLQADKSEAEKYDQIRAHVLDGKVWRGEFCNHRKNGEIFWETAIVAPVQDSEGKFTNFVGVHEEITELKLIKEIDQFINSLDMKSPPSESLFSLSLEKALGLSGSKMGVLIVPAVSGRAVKLFSSHSPRGREYSLDNSEGREMLHWLQELKVCCAEQGGPMLFNTDAEMSSIEFPQKHAKISRMLVIPISYGKKMNAVAILANKDSEYTLIDARVAEYLAEKVWAYTERQYTEKALRESQDRARKIFDSVQTGIVLVDAASREVVDANPAALQLYGGSLLELKGQKCQRLFCAGEGRGCPVLDRHMERENSESVLHRWDGSRIPILKTVTRFVLGSREYLLESFVDLSERKAMEEELHHAIEAAEAAYKAKAMILANMSHEIRTPMNVILGYMQFMARDPDFPARQKRNLDFVHRSGQQLLTIINDILEMARIEAGHVSLKEHSCNFKLLLDDVERMFRFRCQEKGLMLSLEKTSPLSEFLIMDESKVRQVIINLLGNAVKYTETGSIVVRVGQGKETSPALNPGELFNEPDAWVRITVDVEDSGRGIPRGEIDRIFESFERGGAESHSEGGTGLGLAISREFARLLRGDLQLLHSQVNRGSLFRFTFTVRVDTGHLVEPNSRVSRVESIAGETGEWRVLIVDDRYANRDWLMQILQKIGFKVRTAANGRDGIKVMEEWHPDIILMDLVMPEMDGYEAIRRLKAHPVGATIPVIAMSASVMEENAFRAHETGADAFLGKPLQEADLLMAISQLTGLAYTYKTDSEILMEQDEELVREKSLDNKMSREGINAIIAAVESGDTREVNRLLAALPHEDQGDIAKLRVLAEEYDYAGLIKNLKFILGQEKD